MLTYLNILSVFRILSYKYVPHCSNKEQTNQYCKRYVQKIFHERSGVTKQAWVLSWLLLYQLKEKRSELYYGGSEETKRHLEYKQQMAQRKMHFCFTWPNRAYRANRALPSLSRLGTKRNRARRLGRVLPISSTSEIMFG